MDLDKYTPHCVPSVPVSDMDNDAHILIREPHWIMKSTAY